jgi:hypothetical protein
MICKKLLLLVLILKDNRSAEVASITLAIIINVLDGDEVMDLLFVIPKEAEHFQSLFTKRPATTTGRYVGFYVVAGHVEDYIGI